jgi:hypothetical protein
MQEGKSLYGLAHAEGLDKQTQQDVWDTHTRDEVFGPDHSSEVMKFPVMLLKYVVHTNNKII